MKRVIPIFLVLLLIISCKDQGTNPSLLTTLFHQTSAEYRALCYQAFNLAKLRLDEDLKIQDVKKPRAIIFDADETLIDNSPYQAWSVIHNSGYPNNWGAWIQEANATAIPGALDFLNYVHEKGVEIFIVTNRKAHEAEATLKNFRDLGFPIKQENVFVRTGPNSKKERREKFINNYRIVLLMGDNLLDFHELFEVETIEERFKVTDEHREEFGKRYIMLPNVMYGDWIFLPSDKNGKKIKKDDLKGKLKPFK